MPVDTKRPLSNGKPPLPKAPVRSKSGPYLAPKLANHVKTTPTSENGRDGNSKVIDVNSITTPVRSFLATNITPRSSSRRSRAGSANSTPASTPDGTPINSRPGSVSVPIKDLRDFGDRIGIEKRTSISEEPSIIGTPSSIAGEHPTLDMADSMNPTTESMKFFHANDAIFIPKKAPAATLKTGSSNGFVYADGRHEQPTPRPRSQINSASTSQIGSQSKVYSPNGHSDTSPDPNRSWTGFNSTTSPKLPYPIRSPPYAPRARSKSPLKEYEVPGQQTDSKGRRLSGASTVSLKSTTKSIVSAVPTHATKNSSFPEGRMHVKTHSMSSLNSPPITARPTTQPESTLSAIQSPQSTKDLPISPSFFTIKTAQFGSPTTPMSPLASPDRMIASGADNKLDSFNSLAANARTERKVLDLEISNSSLLAINRTLEREMRKQKTELRRYRRLTRGGRLSFVPKDRAVSGATTISTLSIDSDLHLDSDEDGSLTDIPSEDEEEDFEDSDDSSSALSPGAQAEKDLRQREKDEKRLQLDLSKHQQLLIDSQKMNESLKRCLAWTEELILEGKKAIDYGVRAGEVKLGGRVLHADDNPDLHDAPPRLGLLSPTAAHDSEDILWSTGNPSVGVLASNSEDSYISAMADEGKEFREYLDALQESIKQP